MVSRFELAPWIITMGGPAASRGPISSDVEGSAGHLDHAALRGIGALQGHHAGLRDQRQHSQRRHDNC